MICVAYNCFFLPPRIAFGNDDIGPLFVVDIILDIIFLFDVVVNLQTGGCCEDIKNHLICNEPVILTTFCTGFWLEIPSISLALLY